MILHDHPEYKAGDPRPEGYVAFFEWARAQHKGGLRQTWCESCDRWEFPQECKEKKDDSITP